MRLPGKPVRKVLALKVCGPDFSVSATMSRIPYGLFTLCCVEATKVAGVRGTSPFLRHWLWTS